MNFDCQGGEEPERAIWVAVISQAMADACTISKAKDDTKNRADARSWLLNGSDDFKRVCELAGVSPYAVQREAECKAAGGWRPVNLRGRRRRKEITVEA